MSHVTITQVTKCERGVKHVTGLLHMLLLLSHNNMI